MNEEQASQSSSAAPASDPSQDELVDGRPLLPKKKIAVFRGPGGIDLYDGLAMDMHAITYGEACIKAERKRLLQRIEIYAQNMAQGGEGSGAVATVRGLLLGLEVEFEADEQAMAKRYGPI